MFDPAGEWQEAKTEAVTEKENETGREKTEKVKLKYTLGQGLNVELNQTYDPDIEQTYDETEAFNKRGKETGSTRKGKDRYNLGICVFGVLNVILLSLIGITAHYVCSEKNVVVVHNADMCVPCEDLRLHPDDTIEGIERRGEDKTMCCVAEEEEPYALVGYYIEHWLKKKLATDTDRQFVRYNCGDQDIIKPHKPIIKLVGKQELQTAETFELQWDSDDEMAIVPGDDSITHNKESGFIEIKKSGVYQVYSQVVLDHDTNAQNTKYTPDIYFHSMIMIEAERSNHKGPLEITLMKISNSYCESKKNRQTIPSYLDGAFELSEGDKLGVRVLNKTEVIPVPHMNFFGAYML